MIVINLKKNVFFISNESFIQNKLISKNLRNDIMELLYTIKNTQSITCIGGESYIFALCNNSTKYIYHYTNSKYITNDLNFNNVRYRKNIDNNIINYNTFTNIKNANILIINMAKLNINILKVINTRFYKYIIIINCHHSEFWERKKYLSNYKLIQRKQYITNSNFITVNLFKFNSINHEFISLGGNCSVAFHLKNLGLRIHSYPFDWAKVNINTLTNILQNDFTNFTNLNIKKLSNIHHYKFIHNKSSFLLTNPYNVIFAHELMDHNNIDVNNVNLNKLKDKFNLRINRFKNLSLKTNTKITFLLFNLDNSKTDLITLIHHLKKYKSKFELIYISLDTNINSNLYYCSYFKNLNQIKIKYINILYNNIDWKDWSFSKLDWNRIIFNNNEYN